MESSFKEDVGVLKVIQKARDLFDKGNYIKSMELIEDLILVHREDKNAPFLHVLQGKTFYKLAEENPECFVYLLASLECFSYDVKSSKFCAFLFYKLAKKLSDAAEVVVVAILELWHFWKSRERENLVTRLFTVEEKERMSCVKCRRKPNYPEQSSYGIIMAADSIRDLKCALGSIKFVDILKVIRMEYQMSCDIKTGGCGKTNFVHHTINRCPSIFTIVLEWEKSETEDKISETTKALEWEIDISRLYEGLEANTKYRLVSMVGCGAEEEEHICLAYEKNRWVNLRRESLAGENVGNWKNVVRFCGERKIRPEILFYEAVRSM